MLRATLLAALSATALANMMSSSTTGMMAESSSSAMMNGGSGTMMGNMPMSSSSSGMMMSSTTSSALGSLSTPDTNVASCSSQGLNTGLGDQLVTIVQVSDLNGTTLRYSPDNVVAPVGSIVQFQFHPKNHTVTESSFAEPCVKLAANLTSPTRPGQKSGFVPVTAMDTDMKVYNMLINDTKPIWIFCGQPGHCQKGMVMVVNQNATDTVHTLDNFRAAAMQVPLPAGVSSAAPAPASSASSAASIPVGSAAPTPAASTASSSTAAAAGAGPTTVGAPPAAQQASGTGTGLPAAFTGMAMPRAAPAKFIGMGGLAVAGLAALL